jgi:hypothetical protein
MNDQQRKLEPEFLLLYEENWRTEARISKGGDLNLDATDAKDV